MALKKTHSEIFFEKFCDNYRIPYNRIQEASNKTPDYELSIDDQTIIVEVKEIVPNKDEQEAMRLAEERNGLINPPGYTPGDRVRKKISEASPQIKAQTQGRLPSILLLFDRGFIAGHLDPYDVRVAMFGLEQVHVNVPRNPSVGPHITGMSYGPKRKMTDQHNTSISAIGVLFAPKRDEILLHIYHNKFAAVPLEPKLLAKYGILQFELKDEVPGSTAKWKKIDVPNLT